MLWTVVLEKTLESPLDCKEIKPVDLKGNQPWILTGRRYWSWNSSILVIWREQLTHWKSPWCWQRSKAEGREGNRGWNGWMASPIQWPSTWANSRWWGTEKPGMLQSMGPQRVGHDLATERQQRVCEVVFHCGFDLHFSDGWPCWLSFLMGYLYTTILPTNVNIYRVPTMYQALFYVVRLMSKEKKEHRSYILVGRKRLSTCYMS